MRKVVGIVAGIVLGAGLFYAAVAYAAQSYTPQVQSFVIDGKHCILAVMPGTKWAAPTVAISCTWVAGAVPAQELEVRVPSTALKGFVKR